METYMLAFLAFHMMPVWIYLFGIFTSILKSKHTQYMITDKGIYIQSGIFSVTTEIKPFTDLSHVTMYRGLWDRLCGTGDVISICSHSFLASGNGHHGINIENIKDYEKVFRMVKELQESIYADTQYPNDLRPSENHGYNTKPVTSWDEK